MSKEFYIENTRKNFDAFLEAVESYDGSLEAYACLGIAAVEASHAIREAEEVLRITDGLIKTVFGESLTEGDRR
ncbi:MAG: hypothetical protein Q8P81_01125 [Nanoarchaeota archaeon]|nr:hypothetical protein [Nanoarchaeota archaeon]